MKSKIRKIGNKAVIKYILANFNRIEVKPGLCRYNFQCGNNAIHDCIENRDSEVALVYYLDGGYPILHVVNIHNGEYIDNTLGHHSSNHEYYMVRIIGVNDFPDFSQIWSSAREFGESLAPWYVRWLTDFRV